MAARRFRPTTIRPSSGGALVTVGSLDNVGEANYSLKVNFRRFGDKEIRREGWSFFRPNPLAITEEQVAEQALRLTGDINAIAQAVRADGSRVLIAATATTIYRHDTSTGPSFAWTPIGTGYSTAGKRWEVVAVNSQLVFNNGVDLPFTISVADPIPQPIWELRERGIASVWTIAEYYGFLHCFDIREIQATELVAWMNGVTPYGLVPDAKCNRIRQRHIWSEYGQPRNWAPIYTVTLAAEGSVLTLPFPSHTFVANQTRVAVIGGGVNGGTLGGGAGIEDGVLVTAVAGTQLALERATSATITYPRQVQVTRFADVSTVVGYADMTDDGSGIMKALTMRDTLVIYRETGIFIGRYTAVLDQPFAFKRIYNGSNIPYFPDTVIDCQGEGHLFAGRSRFFFFDGVDEPKVFPILDAARANFFATAFGSAGGTRYSAFATHNLMTREVWFCTPQMTLAYDYEGKTCSEIDSGITAATMIVRPSTDDELWFVMAARCTVGWTRYSMLARYGFTTSEAGISRSTHYRFESGVSAWMASGLWVLADVFNEKDVRSYVLHMSSSQAGNLGQPALSVVLEATDDASMPVGLLFTHEISEHQHRSLVSMAYRATFFRDTIHVTPACADMDIQIVGRTIEASICPSASVARSRTFTSVSASNPPGYTPPAYKGPVYDATPASAVFAPMTIGEAPTYHP